MTLTAERETGGAFGSAYTLVNTAEELGRALGALEGAILVAIDLETTGLKSRRDQVRLVSAAIEGHCFVIDCAAIDPAPLFEALAGKRLVGHNISFDLGFMAQWGFEAEDVQDTMVLDILLHAGENGIRHGLGEVAKRELGLDLSKELQRSDWTGSLSAEQIEYAAADASILIPVYASLRAAIDEEGLARAAEVENRSLPAVVWMSRCGVPVDGAAWQRIAVDVDADADRLRAELDRAAPRPPVLDLGFGWSWDSPQSVREALQLAGCDLPNANEDTLSATDHPLANLLRRYRENRKLASTYGKEWLKHIENGRVYPDWRLTGAQSGRMACSNPNLQQIPRDRRFRSCIAAPPGRVLVKADYSQVELRIAARIAPEERMRAAYETGEDLHTLTAQRVLGNDEVSKSDRQLAKAINFGLLYGMGVEGFRRYARVQYGLFLSEEEAGRYRSAFFDAYPGLREWHRRVRTEKVSHTQTLAGRRCSVTKETPLPLRLNLPVQGTGADGLKRALALLWKRRRTVPEAFPIIACHDEIVIECPEEFAAEASEWLRSAMMDGMAPLIRPVPVEVEVSVGKTWAG